ncbi:MAG: GNAT family N-acetyltransferase [Gammaproteobacteria bacterium]
MTRASHTIKAFERLEAISGEDWARLCHGGFPFSDYAYLHALEATGAVGSRSGWIPYHLTAWRGDELEGASFLYLKDNSYGEYIFDWAWAQAYARSGLPYYPKLVSAIPFTPATGPKLLFSRSVDRAALASGLIRAAKEKTEALELSSLHYLFLRSEEIPYFEREGFLIRHSFQYHWKNQDFPSFDAFLASLKPRKRKHILKERQELQSHRLRISILRGADLRPEHATVFHGFYRSTIEKMGAIPYLHLAFFQRVFELMRDQVLLILAEQAGIPVAGALCYENGACLYGRYWGSSREIRNLHFEICYYRPLEYAIAKGLKLFEAGAQGEHKIARGFVPQLTYSAHWIRHPAFRNAIERFIAEEKGVIRAFFEEMKVHSPYRGRSAS